MSARASAMPPITATIIKHTAWSADRQVRLYGRRVGRCEGVFVPESMKGDRNVGAFRADPFHVPYRDWNDHVARVARYTEPASKAARSAGRRGSIARLL